MNLFNNLKYMNNYKLNAKYELYLLVLVYIYLISSF